MYNHKFPRVSARRIESRIGIRYSECAFVQTPRRPAASSPSVLLPSLRLVTHPLQPPLHDLELRLLRVVQQRADLVLRLVRRARFRPSLSLQLVPVLVIERQPGGGGCLDGAARAPRDASQRRRAVPPPCAPSTIAAASAASTSNPDAPARPPVPTGFEPGPQDRPPDGPRLVRVVRGVPRVRAWTASGRRRRTRRIATPEAPRGADEVCCGGGGRRCPGPVSPAPRSIVAPPPSPDAGRRGERPPAGLRQQRPPGRRAARAPSSGARPASPAPSSASRFVVRVVRAEVLSGARLDDALAAHAEAPGGGPSTAKRLPVPVTPAWGASTRTAIRLATLGARRVGR